jgi:hypothetical protein
VKVDLDGTPLIAGVSAADLIEVQQALRSFRVRAAVEMEIDWLVVFLLIKLKSKQIVEIRNN